MAPSKWAISTQVSGGIILTIFFYQIKKSSKCSFSAFAKKVATFSPTNYKQIAKRKATKAAIKTD